VERVDLVVDRLCRRYSSTQAADLLPRVARYRDHVLELRQSRATIREKRDLLLAAGWLSILLACLQVDVGDRQAAETNRRAAFSIGKETAHPELMAWAVEMLAWVALIDERFDIASRAARAGQDLTRIGTSAMVQLLVQEAKAWSQLGSLSDAEAALERAELALAQLPPSSTPEHHFVFDPTKLIFFAGTCYTWLAQDTRAEAHAHEVIVQSHAAGKLTRVAEAHVNLALIAVHRGDIPQAVDLGQQALSGSRPCATTLGRLVELDAALLKHGNGIPEIREFHERYMLITEERLTQVSLPSYAQSLLEIQGRAMLVSAQDRPAGRREDSSLGISSKQTR